MPGFILTILAGAIGLSVAAQPSARTKHLFIITIDGFRWQEVFNGADPQLVANPEYVRDTALTREMYWDPSAEVRRKRLLPFFWGTLAQRGRLYGNRNYGNKMNVRNWLRISYPGYNEIFTGHTDAITSPNLPVNNKHVNVLEYLNHSPDYRGKVAVFTSWSVFPYILNEERSGLPVNSGYEALAESGNEEAGLIDSVMATMHQTKTRHDYLTFCTAREYMRQHHPSVLYLGFGETDECAHGGRYDLYLQQAADIDRMIADLWYEVQTDPYYKDSTTFLITTDHGRGWKPNKWTTHGFWAEGSSEIWMAVLGPDIQAEGEIRSKGQVYQKQLAATMASLCGNPPAPGHPPGKAIRFPVARPADEVAAK